jgi:ABC-type bacteriocin/lantibiotic exporter with double-glycine peptidase domain
MAGHRPRAAPASEDSILDEATSAPWQELLGRQSVCTREEIVDHSGNKVQSDPTTVYVLEGSRIVDSGTHDELLRSSAFYRQLVHTQLVAQ